MNIYLLLWIISPIIAFRVIWVRNTHRINEDLKAEYMHRFNDNTIRRRSKLRRFMDYFMIWLWMRSAFLKQEYREKLKNFKKWKI